MDDILYKAIDWLTEEHNHNMAEYYGDRYCPDKDDTSALDYSNSISIYIRYHTGTDNHSISIEGEETATLTVTDIDQDMLLVYTKEMTVALERLQKLSK